MRLEEKTKSLERRRSEAASFTRQSQAILYGRSKTAAPDAGLGGSESTDAAGALPLHPAPARLESSTAATGSTIQQEVGVAPHYLSTAEHPALSRL